MRTSARMVFPAILSGLILVSPGCNKIPTDPVAAGTRGSNAKQSTDSSKLNSGEQGSSSLSPQVTNTGIAAEGPVVTIEALKATVIKTLGSVELTEDPEESEPTTHEAVSAATGGRKPAPTCYYPTSCSDLKICYTSYERGLWTHFDYTWEGTCGGGWETFKYRPNKQGGYDSVSRTGGAPECSACWDDNQKGSLKK